MWVHSNPSVLNEGRLVHFKPELGEEEDEEVVMKRIESLDPFEPRLKLLSHD